MTYEAEAAALGKAADDDIARAKAEAELQMNRAVKAEQDYADEQSAHAETTAQLERTKMQLTTAQERNATLRQQLYDCRHPKSAVVYGSSLGAHDYETFTKRAGSALAATREYDTWPTAFPAVAKDRGTTTVWSMKPPIADVIAGKIDPQLVAAIRSCPDGTRLIVQHEAENPSKNIKPADFVAMSKHIRPLVDAENTSRGKKSLLYGGNHMAWSYRAASGRDMSKWWPGAGVFDFLAADGYNGRNETTGKWTLAWPEEVFDDFIAFCTAHQITPAIAETGIDVLAPTATRVEWIERCQQYAVDHTMDFWMYWDGSFATFQLLQDVEFAAVVAGP
jgi:hypothetical protein